MADEWSRVAVGGGTTKSMCAFRTYYLCMTGNPAINAARSCRWRGRACMAMFSPQVLLKRVRRRMPDDNGRTRGARVQQRGVLLQGLDCAPLHVKPRGTPGHAAHYAPGRRGPDVDDNDARHQPPASRGRDRLVLGDLPPDRRPALSMSGRVRAPTPSSPIFRLPTAIPNSGTGGKGTL